MSASLLNAEERRAVEAKNWLSRLPQPLQQRLLRLASAGRYEPNEQIIASGDSCAGLMACVSGAIHVRTTTADGSILTVGYITAWCMVRRCWSVRRCHLLARCLRKGSCSDAQRRCEGCSRASCGLSRVLCRCHAIACAPHTPAFHQNRRPLQPTTARASWKGTAWAGEEFWGAC